MAPRGPDKNQGKLAAGSEALTFGEIPAEILLEVTAEGLLERDKDYKSAKGGLLKAMNPIEFSDIDDHSYVFYRVYSNDEKKLGIYYKDISQKESVGYFLNIVGEEFDEAIVKIRKLLPGKKRNIEIAEMIRSFTGLTRGDLGQALEENVDDVFDVGQLERRGRPRKNKLNVHTYDSVEKAFWRNSVKEFMEKIYPGGYESIPENERKLLIFPGMGKEAQMWLEWGFKEDDMIFIERNEKRYLHLKNKFPKAITYKWGFGAEKNPKKKVALAVAIASDLGGDKLSLINIDPENRLTNDFALSLRLLLEVLAKRGALADEVMVGVNLVTGREAEEDLALYKLFGGEAGNEEEPALDLGAWRDKMIEGLLQRIVGYIHYQRRQDDKLEKFSHEVNEFQVGAYEGDSASTRMYFSVSQLSRKKSE